MHVFMQISQETQEIQVETWSHENSFLYYYLKI